MDDKSTTNFPIVRIFHLVDSTDKNCIAAIIITSKYALRVFVATNTHYTLTSHHYTVSYCTTLTERLSSYTPNFCK
jgi:hypothetical protein